jgi:hypothetical protein
VHTGGEVVNAGLLTTQIEDADLGVGNTTVEARLGVRLEMRREDVSKIMPLPSHAEFHHSPFREAQNSPRFLISSPSNRYFLAFSIFRRSR